MNSKRPVLMAAVLWLSVSWQSAIAFAQGTAFTYQGQLAFGTGPANGTYDLTFSLWNAATGGSQAGSTITQTGLAITNGAFTVLLDFGNVFDGTSYWLELGARTNGAAAFTLLSPRQELTPTPYAIFSENAGSANAIINAAVSAPQLNTLGAPSTGQVLGFNGSSLVWVTPSSSTLAWSVLGNAGTSPTNGNFLGTTDNQPLDVRVDNQRALRLLPTPADAAHSRIVNILGGSEVNYVPSANSASGVEVYGATISGGGGVYQGNVLSNAVLSDFGTVGGGGSNACLAPFATIGGGQGNTASGDHASVPGGQGSIASGKSSVAMGSYSVASGDYSIALGGRASGTLAVALGPSTASGPTSTALGESQATGQNSVALGIATANGDYSAALGDATAGGAYSTAAGSAEAYGYASIAEGYGNIVYADYAIALGLDNTAYGTSSIVIGSNSITDGNYAAIGGGAEDTAQADFSTIGGGLNNGTFGTASTVGGGDDNGAYGWADTVAGGEENRARGGSTGGFAPGSFTITGASTVGGGYANQALGFADTVSGGGDNVAGGYASFVGGGDQNLATNSESTVCGGLLNVASGPTGSTVCGGRFNAATSSDATVCGGYGNLASGYGSFAAGVQANATLNNSFIFNGFPNPAYSFKPSRLQVFGTNGISIDYFGQRGDGGGTHWIVLGDGGSQFPGQTISTWTGAYLSDSGTWQNASDRNRKTDLQPIDPLTVLEKVAALPVESWRYTNEVAGVRHVGPMAQDFKASFGLGTDDKTISTVDEGGVALAAIQGLNQKLDEKDAEIERLKSQNEMLEKRLDKLERVVNITPGAN